MYLTFLGTRWELGELLPVTKVQTVNYFAIDAAGKNFAREERIFLLARRKGDLWLIDGTGLAASPNYLNQSGQSRKEEHKALRFRHWRRRGVAASARSNWLAASATRRQVRRSLSASATAAAKGRRDRIPRIRRGPAGKRPWVGWRRICLQEPSAGSGGQLNRGVVRRHLRDEVGKRIRGQLTVGRYIQGKISAGQLKPPEHLLAGHLRPGMPDRKQMRLRSGLL